MNLDHTLAERATTHGDFRDQGRITQTIIRAMGLGAKFSLLADDQREALHMIASKIARIVNGNPHYIDSWHDIAGYATLIEQRLTKETQ